MRDTIYIFLAFTCLVGGFVAGYKYKEAEQHTALSDVYSILEEIEVKLDDD